jgi:hypothetical protein
VIYKWSCLLCRKQISINCLYRKCEALNFYKVDVEIATFPIWKNTEIVFTTEMKDSSRSAACLIAIIWDQEKGEFLDSGSLDRNFSSPLSIVTWIREGQRQHSDLICEKLNQKISTGFISFLRVSPRDAKQVNHLFSNQTLFLDPQTRICADDWNGI